MATACETAILRLSEAQAALHALMTGQRVVELRHADKTIGYYEAGNVKELRTYIRGLQNEVDACNGVRPVGRIVHFIPTDTR